MNRDHLGGFTPCTGLPLVPVDLPILDGTLPRLAGSPTLRCVSVTLSVQCTAHTCASFVTTLGTESLGNMSKATLVVVKTHVAAVSNCGPSCRRCFDSREWKVSLNCLTSLRSHRRTTGEVSLLRSHVACVSKPSRNKMLPQMLQADGFSTSAKDRTQAGARHVIKSRALNPVFSSLSLGRTTLKMVLLEHDVHPQGVSTGVMSSRHTKAIPRVFEATLPPGVASSSHFQTMRPPDTFGLSLPFKSSLSTRLAGRRPCCTDLCVCRVLRCIVSFVCAPAVPAHVRSGVARVRPLFCCCCCFCWTVHSSACFSTTEKSCNPFSVHSNFEPTCPALMAIAKNICPIKRRRKCLRPPFLKHSSQLPKNTNMCLCLNSMKSSST